MIILVESASFRGQVKQVYINTDHIIKIEKEGKDQWLIILKDRQFLSVNNSTVQQIVIKHNNYKE